MLTQNKRLAATATALFALMLLAGGLLHADPYAPQPHGRAAAGVWDFEKLSHPPAFAWGASEQVRTLYFTGEPFRGQPTRVFAFYATPGSLADNPALDHDLPAILLIHGGGGGARAQWARMWAERGYAALSIDLNGNDADGQRMDDGGPPLTFAIFPHITRPIADQWPYHAVANVMLAHSLLRTLPEINAEKTAALGISWGGFITCIVSAVDPRFTATATVYGCGFIHENSFWLNSFAKLTPEQRQQWVSLWDPSQYLDAVTVPMLFLNSGRDRYYPPDSHARSFALVASRKYLFFVPRMGHWGLFGDLRNEMKIADRTSEIFFDHYLKNQAPLPRVKDLSWADSRVTATVTGPAPLVTAALHYTLELLPGNHQRQWMSLEANIDGDTVTAPCPPDKATIWFMSFQDDRGALVASELVFSSHGQVVVPAEQAAWSSE